MPLHRKYCVNRLSTPCATFPLRRKYGLSGAYKSGMIVMRNKFIGVLAAAATVTTISGASAATLESSWTATSAIGSGADHSMWLSHGLGNGIGKDFNFTNGLLNLFDDGTGTLTATAVSQNNANAGFTVSVRYDNTFLQTPKFKSENGSVATGDTFFRDMESGTLTGFGVLAGLDASLTRMPADGKYATQFGSGTATSNGANNKNNQFGMANWFNFSIDQANCAICSNNSVLDGIINAGSVQGDFNLNLAPVPLPASGWMLIAAAGGLAGMRRRKARA